MILIYVLGLATTPTAAILWALMAQALEKNGGIEDCPACDRLGWKIGQGWEIGRHSRITGWVIRRTHDSLVRRMRRHRESWQMDYGMSDEPYWARQRIRWGIPSPHDRQIVSAAKRAGSPFVWTYNG